MMRLIAAWLLILPVLAARGAEWWVLVLVVLPPILVGMLIWTARRLPPDPATERDWHDNAHLM